jgi:predicted HTH domain antitoxin
MSTNVTATLEWWGLDQLLKLRQYRPELVGAAVRRLIQSDEELRWSVVVSAYQDRKINLGKAAELLGLHELELRERFITLGVPLRLGAEDLAEAQAEAAALRSWLAEENTEAQT